METLHICVTCTDTPKVVESDVHVPLEDQPNAVTGFEMKLY